MPELLRLGPKAFDQSPIRVMRSTVGVAATAGFAAGFLAAGFLAAGFAAGFLVAALTGEIGDRVKANADASPSTRPFRITLCIHSPFEDC